MNNLQNVQETENIGGGSSLRDFFTGIYKWMVIGVLISGIFSYIVLHTNLLNVVFSNPIYYYGIVGLELVILLGVQFLIKKIKPKIAQILFIVYAALNGITLAGLFSIYNINSTLAVFAGSIAIFGALAYVGYTTKKDISGMRTFLMVGMWGVFVSSIVNIFLQNSTFDTLISAIAILVFAGLTVYDNQAYKNIYNSVKNNSEEVERYTALGALHMYINFIMIFVNLLKFFGGRD